MSKILPSKSIPAKSKSAKRKATAQVDIGGVLFAIEVVPMKVLGTSIPDIDVDLRRILIPSGDTRSIIRRMMFCIQGLIARDNERTLAAHLPSAN